MTTLQSFVIIDLSEEEIFAKLSICHVTSHDYVVRGSCEIMGSEFCSL